MMVGDSCPRPSPSEPLSGVDPATEEMPGSLLSPGLVLRSEAVMRKDQKDVLSSEKDSDTWHVVAHVAIGSGWMRLPHWRVPKLGQGAWCADRGM